jgi:hypothetical protein
MGAFAAKHSPAETSARHRLVAKAIAWDGAVALWKHSSGGATSRRCWAAQASASVYWTNYNSNTIGRANLDGTDPNQSFIAGATGPAGVAVDGGPAGTATASAPALTFASQPLDTYSAPQMLTVTDTGHGELQIGSAQVTAGDADDFLITTDTCSGARLWSGDTCAIDVRFGPTATSTTNGRSATLTVSSNDLESPLSITLQGTGGTLPQGPTGATGATGQGGRTGATGPPGPAGEIELVTCKPVKTGKRKHKKTVKKCATKLTSSPVKFTTSRDVIAAVLSRGDVVYARGLASRAGEKTTLLLTARRTIHKGSYTLTLTRRGHRQREPITI